MKNDNWWWPYHISWHTLQWHMTITLNAKWKMTPMIPYYILWHTSPDTHNYHYHWMWNENAPQWWPYHILQHYSPGWHNDHCHWKPKWKIAPDDDHINFVTNMVSGWILPLPPNVKWKITPGYDYIYIVHNSHQLHNNCYSWSHWKWCKCNTYI